MRELRNTSSNINYPYIDAIWIVPEYTTAPHEACTAFNLTFGGQHASDDNLAVHDGRHCYLVPVKDQAIKNKITEVALVRDEGTLSGSRILAKYQGITGNIKQHWSSLDELYLVWKTANI